MNSKDLIIGKKYLVQSKRYGVRKASFNGFETIKDFGEFASFLELGLNWMIPVDEIEEKVKEYESEIYPLPYSSGF